MDGTIKEIVTYIDNLITVAQVNIKILTKVIKQEENKEASDKLSNRIMMCVNKSHLDILEKVSAKIVEITAKNPEE
ncbi:hypothetical protein LCGC14_2990370 [marine sediment metagenome]|uniref:Uncharacterized protein n=1 Tax=marine sediment metagenome TaxID=412755 RepID=A0A0F8XRJ5_9ZZZZ